MSAPAQASKELPIRFDKISKFSARNHKKTEQDANVSFLTSIQISLKIVWFKALLLTLPVPLLDRSRSTVSVSPCVPCETLYRVAL